MGKLCRLALPLEAGAFNAEILARKLGRAEATGDLAMSLPLLSPNTWHTTLLSLALGLGCEGAVLLFASFTTKQRWRERILALLPVATFVWMLLLARSVQAQTTYWVSYFAFQATYYPSDTYLPLYLQTQEEFKQVIANINRLGWTAVGVTEGMVLVGGALLLRWYQPAQRRQEPKPRKREDLTQVMDEASDLEIVIEPMNRDRDKNASRNDDRRGLRM